MNDRHPLDPTAARHPIAVVEERTGLTQDVLRVWERRYGAVQPGRSAGGQRRYSDADIERLRLLQAATRSGRSIGQIARLPTHEVARLAGEDAAARTERGAAHASQLEVAAAELVAQALIHTRAMDASRLEALIRRGLLLYGVPEFLERVATPILRKVGDEWHAGRLTPSQEHLASAALNDLISETMRSVSAPESAPRIIVATPAGERHGIGAALVGAAAAADGWRVISLGTDLPAVEIAAAAVATAAVVVAVSLLYVAEPDQVIGELRSLRARVPAAVEIIAGGPGALALGDKLTGSGVRIGASLADLREMLRERVARAGG
jgi:DNA-binding transcriptional MerR regulator/methylmalonyl-CoA mutase cobalamin-binding subunit